MNLNVKSCLFVGDIAGEYDCLIRLLEKSPPTEVIVMLGDLNDRGPKSRDVIEYCMKNDLELGGRVVALDSNHGHMFVDFVEQNGVYHPEDFLHNGGGTTLMSYGSPRVGTLAEILKPIDRSHIDWLKTRPNFCIINDMVLATHAPLHPDLELIQAIETRSEAALMRSVLWNRHEPIPREEFPFQIYGHNSRWMEHRNHRDGFWGACIDNGRRRELISLAWPSMQYTREPYKENPPEVENGR